MGWEGLMLHQQKNKIPEISKDGVQKQSFSTAQRAHQVLVASASRHTKRTAMEFNCKKLDKILIKIE
jgi:hypothetical protein